MGFILFYSEYKSNLSQREARIANLGCWIRWLYIMLSMTICLIIQPTVSMSMEGFSFQIGENADADLKELERRVARIWGSKNVWIPQPKVLVKYENDLGERHAVDFENGVAYVQILIKADTNAQREIVVAHLKQGARNLIVGDPKCPVEMIKPTKITSKSATLKENPDPAIQALKEMRIYIVQKGDSLWKIARKFGMRQSALVKLNGIVPDTVLMIGRPLKVMVFSSHDLTLDASLRPAAENPLLLDQIRMVDGSEVPHWMVRDFVAEAMQNKPMRVEKIIGDDGIERQAVGIEFNLVSNHLELRARKYQPLVLAHAQKHQLDPALIMAIIHTESVFNPRARSNTPAYGLMQLVPRSGGREAYRMVYGQNRKLTPQYLFDPNNNIELGTAYFTILKNRYMGGIKDPSSQTYCAVAGYNAGAANVGKAFISKKSINRAIPVINQLESHEVYSRLTEALPYKESRNYVRKVLDRARLYRSWN